jgi:catechol 2,3-dioxygenase-like lactoylglutathione lyase family enzyme
MEIISVENLTRSAAETADYYETVLGLPVVRRVGVVEVAVGATTMVFREDPETTGDQHYAFLIDDARFDAARAFLEAGPGLLSDGDRIEIEAQDAWNARSLYFPGPDRSILEVIARRDLHSGSTTLAGQPFGPADLLSVSEVGVAVLDVPAVAARLGEVGIGRYGAWSSETFSPAGHIDGMLILVSPGRTWFPSSDRVVGEPPVTITATAPCEGLGAVVAGTYELAPGRTLVVAAA